MRRLTIAGLIAALTLGSFVLAASAQNPDRPTFWPALSKIDPAPKVMEWYSDIPWHQKLATFAGNEIDEALVLPYDALGDPEKAFCTSNQLTPQECMIEAGINNVLGIHRTDTLYDTTDPKITASTVCQSSSHPDSQPCIEVKLELSSFWNRANGSAIELQARPFGMEIPDSSGAYYPGYVITDGTTYAPQMPWYMAHYCDSQFVPTANDMQDPVCYGDYFSPMNDGFSPFGLGATDWPNSVPWSVFPSATYPMAPANHCPSGVTECTLVMGGFDLSPVPQNFNDLQYNKYNQFLLTWFNDALQNFPNDLGQADLQRHFPWNGMGVSWDTFLYPQALLNPFLGTFPFTQTAPANPLTTCDVTLTGPTDPSCTNTAIFRASPNLYPRQCTLADLAGTDTEVASLRQCGLNYEFHHNGWKDEWPEAFWQDIQDAGMLANQYGRTSFLFAGVPGMQMPVSFYKDPNSVSGLSVYEQVYNASIFSLYLPIANEADDVNAFHGRNYTDTEFYHTLLMSDHMESDPPEFAEGIRGRVLWHDEYRTQKMYEADALADSQGKPEPFGTETFAAAFDPQTAPAPFHNNTCDGCHVRNGSGIPINPAGTLDVTLQEFMTSEVYNPYPVKDYTFTGQIRPMKLVFFDLQRDLQRGLQGASRLDDSVYSKPLAFSPNVVAQPRGAFATQNFYYNNKVMNFYGDSFHATRPGYNYTWYYEPANSNRMVVNTARVNSELNITYQPQQVTLGTFQTDPSCQLVLPSPTSKPWPENCNDINDAAIHGAIDGGQVGFMLLNGKRLGNLSAIEAIPNAAIVDFQKSQSAALGPTIAGEILWNNGSRDGVDGEVHLACQTKSLTDCYIGRFGWLGDRVSLEDQVANAAFVEMNMTTSAGYNKLYPNGAMFPIRYAFPNCGPADKTCVESKGNADLSEQDVNRMADYARWLGNPTRSEFTVSLPEVIAGEGIFQQLQCDTCHVIK